MTDRKYSQVCILLIYHNPAFSENTCNIYNTLENCPFSCSHTLNISQYCLFSENYWYTFEPLTFLCYHTLSVSKYCLFSENLSFLEYIGNSHILNTLNTSQYCFLSPFQSSCHKVSKQLTCWILRWLWLSHSHSLWLSDILILTL